MIKFAGHTFVLDPDRAIHWPDRQTLIVADVHFGKAAIFRENGLPVPAGTTAGDLCRLDQLIARTQPRRLLILGDCFHGTVADPAPIMAQLTGWRSTRSELAIELVRGNHDRRVDAIARELRITVHDRPLEELGICFAHEPAENPKSPIVCGHIHPATMLRDFDGHGVRLPCFVVEPRQLILPAFGGFTGSCTVGPASGRQLFVAARGRIVAIDATMQQARR